MNEQHLKEWAENIIRNFIETSSENSLENAANEKAWEDCLIGFSNGADDIFEAYIIFEATLIFYIAVPV